jgi:signal transduction histidine kinase
MSHEIRTPLNAIIGLTELSIINGVTGKHKDFVIKINDCASTLLKTIDDILHYSKLEAGQVESRTDPFYDLRYHRKNTIAFSA